MGKAKKDQGAAGKVEALLAAGDHAAARREAERIIADAGSTEAAREAARAAIASLRPERAAVLVGLGCTLLAAAVLGRVLAG